MSKKQKEIMKNTLILLIAVTLLTCNVIRGEQYGISGKITNTTQKALYLEKISHQTITLVDSGIIKNGEFKMKGNIEQLGFYRIVLKGASEQQNKTWLLCLEPKENVTITLDANNVNVYEIKGSTNQLDFQNTLKSMNIQQGELMQLSSQYQSIAQNNPNSNDAQSLSQLIQTKSQNFQKYVDDVLKNSKNIITKYYIYSIILQQMQNQQLPQEMLTEIRNFSKILSASLPKSIYAQDFETVVKNMDIQNQAGQAKAEKDSKLAVGAVAPDIEFIDEAGKKVKLSSFRGKVVLIDFWASWCRPCRMENPNVVAAYNKYKDKGFTVISISQDQDLTKWQAAIKQDGLIWPNHFADRKINGKASMTYNIEYIPKTYLLDKNGNIIGKDLRGAMLEQELEKIIK
jgi:peroxiredoxin